MATDAELLIGLSNPRLNGPPLPDTAGRAQGKPGGKSQGLIQQVQKTDAGTVQRCKCRRAALAVMAKTAALARVSGRHP